MCLFYEYNKIYTFHYIYTLQIDIDLKHNMVIKNILYTGNMASGIHDMITTGKYIWTLKCMGMFRQLHL